MIQAFLGKTRASYSGSGTWPQTRVVDVLNRQFQTVEHLGEEAGFTLYGVSDNGVNFVVALILSAKGKVSEIGFLARFVGFPVDEGAVERLNRNLHLSVVGLEDGDLFLLAGVEAAGSFDEKAFAQLLDTWRRDLMMVLHTLSGGSSIAAAFPAARSETARRFAANQAPVTENGVMPDLLRGFLGHGETKVLCADCNGRGRRGLIARTCDECDGSGFVAARE